MRRFWILPALSFFLLVLAQAWAQKAGAQQAAPIAVRVSYVAQLPDPDKLFSEPPDITLVPRGQGARHGHLWIRTWPDGLIIAGKVDGGPPGFPYTKDQIMSRDHVEVWLTGAPDVDLPKIGWGNQHEDVTLDKGAESCADWVKTDPQANSRVNFDPLKACQEWAATQVRYRPYFQRLFARQWLMTPDFTIEAFATPAFEEIQRWFGGLPEVMKPKQNPNMGRADTRLHPEPTGYSFQVLIPRVAFPPLPASNVRKLYLLVDVFNAAPVGKKMGAYSTSSPARVWGKPITFNRLRLDPPTLFSVTPCNLPLTGKDKEADKPRQDQPAWLVPDPNPSHPFVSDTFIVVNDSAGYRYEPEGLSPTVRVTHHFWKNVGKEEWVCGPEMTYFKEGRSHGASTTIGEDGFDAKRLPDGTLLVKEGPRAQYSEFGSGECGGCPMSVLRIFDVGKDLNPYWALDIGDGVGGAGHPIVSEDFSVSPDWSRITKYQLTNSLMVRGFGFYDREYNGTGWSSTTWCLQKSPPGEAGGGYEYQICDVKQNVKPPNPPLVKKLRMGDEEATAAQAPPPTSKNETPAKSNQAAGEAGGAPAGVLPSVAGTPPPPPLRGAVPRRIRVGPEVASAKLLFQPPPKYPPSAKRARIQGIVRFDAVINKDGTIQELRVISGHPLLVMEALDAVLRWRYQTTLLNGEPVEVTTEIDVPFALPE